MRPHPPKQTTLAAVCAAALLTAASGTRLTLAADPVFRDYAPNPHTNWAGAVVQILDGKPDLLPRGGYLDDTYFKRTPWTFGGNQNYGRLLVHDSQSVYFVRMFDTLKHLDPMVFFTPGVKRYLLLAKNLGGKQDTWSLRVPVRVRAMVRADQRLVVAGPPDRVDSRDPLGAFEGRQGGLMYVIDTATGQKRAELKLPSPPVFNGAAAARGRLYIADEEGSLSCLGKRSYQQVREPRHVIIRNQE